MKRTLHGIRYDTESDLTLGQLDIDGGRTEEIRKTPDGHLYIATTVRQVHECGEWRDIMEHDADLVEAQFSNGRNSNLRQMDVIMPIERMDARAWFIRNFVPEELWKESAV